MSKELLLQFAPLPVDKKPRKVSLELKSLATFVRKAFFTGEEEQELSPVYIGE
jgi:hypothetical protein